MGFVNSEGKILLDDNLGRFAILDSEFNVLKVFRSSISKDDWRMCGAWWDEPYIRYVHQYFEGGDKIEIGKADESGILESKQPTPSFGGLDVAFAGGVFINDHYYLVGCVADYPSAGRTSALLAKITKDYAVEWAKVYSDPDVSIIFDQRGITYFNGKLIVTGGGTIAILNDADGSLDTGKYVEKEGGTWILGGMTESIKASPDRIFVFNPPYFVAFDHSLNILACREEQPEYKLSGGCSAGITVKSDGNVLALSEGVTDYPGRIIIEFSPDGVVQKAKRLASSYSGFNCGLKAEIVEDKLYACWEPYSPDSIIAYLIACGIDLSLPNCPIWADETVTFGDITYSITDAIANVENATVNIADVTSKFSPVSATFTKECPT